MMLGGIIKSFYREVYTRNKNYFRIYSYEYIAKYRNDSIRVIIMAMIKDKYE